VIASRRQRVRRALRRLSLTPAQARSVGRLLRDERAQLEAAEQLLAECRRQLREALSPLEPDAASVLELTVHERLLERRERQLAVALQKKVAAALRPEQALRLQGLPPLALGDLLTRLSA
jgi:Spy/CpxP family protein refolding chaperone